MQTNIEHLTLFLPKKQQKYDSKAEQNFDMKTLSLMPFLITIPQPHNLIALLGKSKDFYDSEGTLFKAIPDWLVVNERNMVSYIIEFKDGILNRKTTWRAANNAIKNIDRSRHKDESSFKYSQMLHGWNHSIYRLIAMQEQTEANTQVIVVDQHFSNPKWGADKKAKKSKSHKDLLEKSGITCLTPKEFQKYWGITTLQDVPFA